MRGGNGLQEKAGRAINNTKAQAGMEASPEVKWKIERPEKSSSFGHAPH
jgi:hypothetical protein